MQRKKLGLAPNTKLMRTLRLILQTAVTAKLIVSGGGSLAGFIGGIVIGVLLPGGGGPSPKPRKPSPPHPGSPIVKPNPPRPPIRPRYQE